MSSLSGSYTTVASDASSSSVRWPWRRRFRPSARSRSATMRQKSRRRSPETTMIMEKPMQVAESSMMIGGQ